MGEKVRKGAVKEFRKCSDLSLKDIATPTLFNRPDIMTTVYTAAPVEGGTATKGDRLVAHAAADGRAVDLVKGHVVVFRIDCDGAKSLLGALREPGNPGLAPMRVEKVSSVSGFIEAVVDDDRETG